jgi:hypothetical protein
MIDLFIRVNEGNIIKRITDGTGKLAEALIWHTTAATSVPQQATHTLDDVETTHDMHDVDDLSEEKGNK